MVNCLHKRVGERIPKQGKIWMAVVRAMLEAGLGTVLLTADSVSLQRQGMCRKVPVPLPAMCWFLADGSFPLYSTSGFASC